MRLGLEFSLLVRVKNEVCVKVRVRFIKLDLKVGPVRGEGNDYIRLTLSVRVGLSIELFVTIN